MKNVRGFYGKTVTIDSARLRTDIKSLPKKMNEYKNISVKVLGKSPGYLDHCFRKGGMNRDSLDKLCGVFGFNPNDYVVVSKPEPVVVVEPETEKPQEQTQPTNNSDIVAAIKELTKSVNQLMIIQTTALKKLDAMETRLTKIEGNKKSINEMTEVGLESIDDSIAKVNSKLNIVNGRLEDIYRQRKGE